MPTTMAHVIADVTRESVAEIAVVMAVTARACTILAKCTRNIQVRTTQATNSALVKPLSIRVCRRMRIRCHVQRRTFAAAHRFALSRKLADHLSLVTFVKFSSPGV